MHSLHLAEFNLPAIKSLFEGVDFVGISAYIPLATPWFEVRMRGQESRRGRSHRRLRHGCCWWGSPASVLVLGGGGGLFGRHSLKASGAHPPSASQVWCGECLTNPKPDQQTLNPHPCPQACDLEGLMSDLDDEFGFYGLTLRELSRQGEEQSLHPKPQKWHSGGAPKLILSLSCSSPWPPQGIRGRAGRLVTCTMSPSLRHSGFRVCWQPSSDYPVHGHAPHPTLHPLAMSSPLNVPMPPHPTLWLPQERSSNGSSLVWGGAPTPPGTRKPPLLRWV